ncbi:MAG: hypothetical protein ACFFCS_06020 [Candidatus Hodarchaeota archaeon]
MNVKPIHQVTELKRKSFDRKKILALLLLGGAIAANLTIGIVVIRPAITATNLGTPVKSMTIWSRLLVRDVQTGRAVFYAGTYTDAGNSRLVRFDHAVNQTEYYDLRGTKGLYGVCEGADGKLYMTTGNGAKFFSFDPVTKNLREFGNAADEDILYDPHLGPDGCIYAGSYPNAKLFKLDPATGVISDLGRMHPTEQYIRDLAVAANGMVFCGIGSKADIIAYDPSTKQKTSILPVQYKNNSFAYKMDSEDNIIYAFLHFDQIVLIFNATDNSLLLEVVHPSGGGVNIHRQMSGSPVYITGHPDGYKRFNSTTHVLDNYTTPSYDNYDPVTNISYNGDSQDFTAYNLSSSTTIASVNVANDGEGLNIFSLGTGPDGCVYGGVYMLLHLFKYDPGTEVLEDLGQYIPSASGEIYSLLNHDDKLYIASYTYSILSVYDPSQPWNPGTSNTSNPRKIGSVGDEQYRPPALVAGSDGKVYVGSIAAYGKYGGALTAYDPVNDSFEVHRHIVPNQSVRSLTPGLDGTIIYGGSSIYGDYAQPLATTARFFAFNTTSNVTSWSIIPVPGCTEVSALATAPDGKIFGCASSTIFIYDPIKNEIVFQEKSKVGSIKRMFKWTDGFIYGISSDHVFRLKPGMGLNGYFSIDYFHSGGTDLTIDDDGKIYFAQGTDLYVLDGIKAG